MIKSGQIWQTGDWRAEPRFVEIVKVDDDEVSFRMGRFKSRLSRTAFLRTYRRNEPVSPRSSEPSGHSPGSANG